MVKKVGFTVLLISVLALTIGGIATAAPEPIPTRFSGIATDITTGEDLVETIEGIADWIFIALLVASVIFIVLAAFQFITSGGDPNAVGEARRKLLYAAIGIVVGTLAKAIPLAIRNITGT